MTDSRTIEIPADMATDVLAILTGALSIGTTEASTAELFLRRALQGDDGERRSSEPCKIIPDGTDTNGDEWHRCTVHGFLIIGDAPVCEGYEPPYFGPYEALEASRQRVREAVEAMHAAGRALQAHESTGDPHTADQLAESAALDARAETMAREGDA